MTVDDPSTKGTDYTRRLERLELSWWKRVLDVQRPYRRHLQKLELGFTLDVGCGIGRNLAHLSGNAVGVDHNPESVAVARRRGLTAFVPTEFRRSGYAKPGRFDSLLCSHVIEHMRPSEAASLLSKYLPFVRPGGRVVLITPQEAGFRSDETHVEFADLATLARLARDVGLEPARAYSQPFPRAIGRVFRHNEFVLIAHVPSRASTI